MIFFKHAPISLGVVVKYLQPMGNLLFLSHIFHLQLNKWLKRAISSIGCSITFSESTPRGNVLFAITQKLNHYEYSFTLLRDYETLPLISIFLLLIPSPPSFFIPLSYSLYWQVSENFLSLNFVAFNYFCRTGRKFWLSISTV